MRFDTADADPDASSHADSGDNPHSHANAYPNASPNRYSHADSDANHHSHTNSYSNTHANPHSRANTGTDVTTNASANAGTDASASTHNTRTYDCHNSRPGDRCNTQPHWLNARLRDRLQLCAPSAGRESTTANVRAPLPHAHGCAHKRSARDNICSGNQPGPSALHARGNTCPGSWPDALAITSAPSLGRSTRDAIEPRWSTFPPPVPGPPFRPTVLMSRRGT